MERSLQKFPPGIHSNIQDHWQGSADAPFKFGTSSSKEKLGMASVWGPRMRHRMAAKLAITTQFRSLKRGLMLFYLPFCNLLP
jgi:hypothetical protein